MSTQFDKIPIGVLNPISLNTNTIIFDSRQDSSVNHLRKVIREVSNPNSFDTSMGFIGVVLYAPPGIIAPSPGTNASLIESVTKYGGINLGQIIVRIPELHAFLPEPENEEDFKRIIQHPIFTAINDSVLPPKVGDLVIVDFKNRVNRTDGLYISKVKDAGVMNGSTSTGTSAQQAVNNGKRAENNKTPQAPISTEHYKADFLLRKGNTPTTRDNWNELSPQTQFNLNKLTKNVETIHQYCKQIADLGIINPNTGTPLFPNYQGKVEIHNVHAFDNPLHPYANKKGDPVHIQGGPHGEGRAIDLDIYYFTSKTSKKQAVRDLVWAVCMKLIETQHVSPGGVGAYMKREILPDGSRNWNATPHYDWRGKTSNWYWAPNESSKIPGPLKQFSNLLEALPAPDPSVKKWSEQNIK